MVAGRYSLYCEQGATMFVPFQWTDNDGDPIDLTGYSIRMQVRRTHDADDILVDLGENDYIVVQNTAADGDPEDYTEGLMRILIPKHVTAEFPPDKYVYDIELEDPDGNAIRLLEGYFIVTAGVTR